MMSIIEMELTEYYDSSDSFIDKRLICVSEDIDTLDLETSFQMKGESGTLEIADNETGETLWSKTWNENVENDWQDMEQLEKEYRIKIGGSDMKKKLIALALPVGLCIELVYFIGNRFFVEFPDVIAYPMLIVSMGLMIIGLIYNGYCFGKHKNPYDFK